MIKTAIVEDDIKNQQELTAYLHQYEKSREEAFEIHCFTNGLAFIDSYTADYDLIFMDIEMPYMNGMEAAKKMREKDEDVALIFMTIFSQYSLFGYDVDASAFLIKPLNYDIVKDKLDKILERRKKENQAFAVFSEGEDHYKVFYKDVAYVDTVNHYSYYHTKDGKSFRKYQSLNEAEEKVKDSGFIRASSSFLINPLYVTSYTKDSVILGKIATIPISRSKKKTFFEELTQRFGEKQQ